MKVNYRLYLWGVILTCLAGCHSSMSTDEYISWMQEEDNVLRNAKKMNGFSFEVQYLPSEYRFISQQVSHTSHMLAKYKHEQAGVQFFNVTLSHESNADLLSILASTHEEEQQALYYLSYSFQQDIYLEACGQKIPCSLFHFERSYDMKKSRTFVVGFESDCVDAASLKLVLDSEVLPTGPVKIKITTEDIPELKL